MSPTNGGSSWETARPIFDPGQNDQTIGNQIVALGNGDLANVMMVFTNDHRAPGRSARRCCAPQGIRTKTHPTIVSRSSGCCSLVLQRWCPLYRSLPARCGPLDNYRVRGAFS